MKDDNFHTTVEDKNATGGNSELLLHRESEKRQDTTGIENFRRVRSGQSKETIGTQSIVPSGQVFSGKAHDTNNNLDFELKDGDYFKEADSCFVGLSSSTNLKQYPHDAGIVVHLRDICGLQKPKLIGCSNDGQGVIVYQAIQLENISVRPVVVSFLKNMEHEVPTELVKIGREE